MALQTWQVAIPADDTNKSDLHAQRHEEHTNSENACYHPVQYLSSSRTWCKNIDIRKNWEHRPVILTAVRACETASDIHGRVFGSKG
jgi:hypothetical protein